MADLDILLQDYSYLKSLEQKNAIPKKVAKNLQLPHTSVKRIVEHIFAETGELKFDRLFRRPIGFRCMADCWSSVGYTASNGTHASGCAEICQLAKNMTALDLGEAHTELEKLMDLCFNNKEKDFKALFKAEHLDALQKLHEQVAEKLAKLPQASNSGNDNNNSSSSSNNNDNTPPAKPKGAAEFVHFGNMLKGLSHDAKKYLAGSPWDAFLRSDGFTRYCQWKHLELNMTVSELDFDVHRIIGRGGFGEVFPCRKRDTGAVFAMKKLYKKRLKMKNQEASAVHERNVLAELSSKFVTTLKYAFSDADTLYLILDLMEGGDLSFHLKNKSKFTEAETRFYAAEIALGLAHLHSQKLLYRDLKPANILLDEHGHARISDMGLVRALKRGNPTSQCGTCGYMAPEVLREGVEYGLPSDWFSFGCLVFELLVGKSPFRMNANSTEEVDHRTLEKEVEMPDFLSSDARDLCTRLLAKDPKERLGSAEGIAEIRRHAFFKSMDWVALFDHKIEPPIKPYQWKVNAKNVYDIPRMDPRETSKVTITPEENLKYYSKFSHIMSHQWQEEVLKSVYDLVIAEADKEERKIRKKSRRSSAALPYDDSQVILSGFVRKQSRGFMKKWGRRFFVLTKRTLFVMHDPSGIGAKEIAIASLRSVDKVDVNKRGTQGVRITTKDEKEVLFHCEHETDLAVWMAKLSDLSKTFGKSGSMAVVVSEARLSTSMIGNDGALADSALREAIDSMGESQDGTHQPPPGIVSSATSSTTALTSPTSANTQSGKDGRDAADADDNDGNERRGTDWGDEDETEKSVEGTNNSNKRANDDDDDDDDGDEGEK